MIYLPHQLRFTGTNRFPVIAAVSTARTESPSKLRASVPCVCAILPAATLALCSLGEEDKMVGAGLLPASLMERAFRGSLCALAAFLEDEEGIATFRAPSPTLRYGQGGIAVTPMSRMMAGRQSCRRTCAASITSDWKSGKWLTSHKRQIYILF